MTDSAQLLSLIQALETGLHQYAIRSDAGMVNKLLHKDFVETGRSGQIYTREQSLSALAAETSQSEIQASDFALAILADGVVLLTYKSFQQDAAGIISKRALRSSIWMMSEDANWQMRFHQGTPAAA